MSIDSLDPQDYGVPSPEQPRMALEKLQALGRFVEPAGEQHRRPGKPWDPLMSDFRMVTHASATFGRDTMDGARRTKKGGVCCLSPKR